MRKMLEKEQRKRVITFNNPKRNLTQKRNIEIDETGRRILYGIIKTEETGLPATLAEETVDSSEHVTDS
jgi:hypothetical protein